MNYAPRHALFNDFFDNFFVAISNQPKKTYKHTYAENG